MNTHADSRIVATALEVVEHAEQRAGLSAAEAEKLRAALGAAVHAERPRRRPATTLSPRIERLILGLSEGIVYGMNAGLAVGIGAVLLTGAGGYVAPGGMAGTLIGFGVAAGRELRTRRHVH